LHAPQGVQMTKVADQDSTDLQKCLVVASSLLTVPSPCRLSQVVVLAVDALVFLE
jgi:thiamine pyrophosphokinase